MKLLFLLSLLVACTAAAAQSAQVPAWACGVLKDYYAVETTECAAPSCNAAQRNLGGQILVLDTRSYGSKGCQGCNPEIPKTCCQACEDMDGCNAWVVCTNKNGCGSGCQAYKQQFKGTLSYDDPLPHTFWGNWGGCEGDKWPLGMCSLKKVDTKNPPVTSTDASQGWVSGITTKSPGDSRCPPELSKASCQACLATNDPSKCLECMKNSRSMAPRAICPVCAQFSNAAAQSACMACAANPNEICKRCLYSDCSSVECLNARQNNPAKASNVPAVERCYAKAAGAAAKPSG